MSKNIIADTLLDYNKIAIMEIHQGNFEKALETFKKSYFIESELNFVKEKAQTLVNIANTEMLLNEPTQALESLKEALGILEKSRATKDYNQTLFLMGTIYIALEDIKEAEKALYKVVQKTDSDDMKGEAYFNLHNVYLKDSNNYKAQDSITKSIQHFERSKNTERLKQAFQSRAEFFKILNRKDLAAMDLNKVKLFDNDMEL